MSTAVFPPFTMFTTPFGNPIFSSNSNARFIVSGTRSEPFSTNVFPVAIAYGKNQKGIIAGKLNAVIAATTPIGWRIIVSSIPRATSSRL